ncbi:hypothetical protein C8R43DRAFT_942655 [Mycena crocata]|nr:hypothetical protein C8R43DRAFT_942655 [Mycena crocata]
MLPYAIYPDGRVNPAAHNFKSKTPVDGSPNLKPAFEDRYLDREARAITRFLTDCGCNASDIAACFVVPVRKVKDAIKNAAGDSLQSDKRFGTSQTNFLLSSQTVIVLLLIQDPPTMNLTQKVYSMPTTQEESNSNKELHAAVEKKRVGPVWANYIHPPAPQPIFCEVPSCQDFIRGIPAVRAFHHGTRFCKKGRAVARIVYPYFDSYASVGRIFGSSHVPVRHAVLNDYRDKDDTSGDFEEAGEEFRVAFPEYLYTSILVSKEQPAQPMGPLRSQTYALDPVLHGKYPTRYT